MCNSKAEGGQRCGCDDSEKRRLRRHNSAALIRNDQAKVTSPASAITYPYSSPSFDHTPTVSEIKAEVDSIRNLKEQWLNLDDKTSPEAQVFVDDMRQQSIVVGAMIVNRAENIYGAHTHQQVEQETYKELAKREAELLEEKATCEEYRQKAKELEKELISFTSDLDAYRRTKNQAESYRDMAAAAQDTYIAEALKRLEREKQILMYRNREQKFLQGQAYLQVVSEIRPLGGEVKILGGKEALVQQLTETVQKLPQDWIQQANTLNPLLVGTLPETGTAQTAYYVPEVEYLGRGKFWHSVQDIKELNKELGVKLPLHKKLTNYAMIRAKENLERVNVADLSTDNREIVKRAKSINEDSNLMHEFLHRVEPTQQGLLLRMEESFLEDRISHTGVRETRVTVGDNSNPVNFYYRDSFATQHAGTDYRKDSNDEPGPSKAWEILSIGAEMTFGGRDDGFQTSSMYTNNDDHYRDFIVGLWASI